MYVKLFLVFHLCLTKPFLKHVFDHVFFFLDFSYWEHVSNKDNMSKGFFCLFVFKEKKTENVGKDVMDLPTYASVVKV